MSTETKAQHKNNVTLAYIYTAADYTDELAGMMTMTMLIIVIIIISIIVVTIKVELIQKVTLLGTARMLRKVLEHGMDRRQ